jgi:hypothetical protein
MREGRLFMKFGLQKNSWEVMNILYCRIHIKILTKAGHRNILASGAQIGGSGHGTR